MKFTCMLIAESAVSEFLFRLMNRTRAFPSSAVHSQVLGLPRLPRVSIHEVNRFCLFVLLCEPCLKNASLGFSGQHVSLKRVDSSKLSPQLTQRTCYPV